ncbi:MAG: DMT family transporter [Acidimicrobiales bacterium]
MKLVIAVLAALAAGGAFAVGSVLQHIGARDAPSADSLRPRLLLGLLHDRRWLAGLGISAASFCLQAVALAFGPIGLVQPVIVTEVVFALPLAVRVKGMRLGRREWVATALLFGGLSAFLVGASPRPGLPDPAVAVWAWVALAVGAVVAASLTAAAVLKDRLPPAARASLLGAGAGACFGLVSALVRSVMYAVTTMPAPWPHVFVTWQPYALAVVAAGGGLIGQSAFQAGPLAASLPVIDAMEPAVAIGIAVVAFGEKLSGGALARPLEAAGAIAVLYSIWVLDRSRVICSASMKPVVHTPLEIGEGEGEGVEPRSGGRRAGEGPGLEPCHGPG